MVAMGASVIEPGNQGNTFIAPGSAPSVKTSLENVTATVSSLFLFGAVIYMILAGWKYMTAGGEQEKFTEAKNNFIWGIMGIAVAVLAYALPKLISTFVGGGGELK